MFGAQDFELKRFSEIVGNNRLMESRLTRTACLSSFVVEMFAALALAMIVYYALGSFPLVSSPHSLAHY